MPVVVGIRTSSIWWWIPKLLRGRWHRGWKTEDSRWTKVERFADGVCREPLDD